MPSIGRILAAINRLDQIGHGRVNRTTGHAFLHLLGGPGETPESLATTIDFVKKIDPDCAGTSLGIHIYPGTDIVQTILNEGPMELNPAIRRKYTGDIDLFQPTFYISKELGPNPARLVKDLIAGGWELGTPSRLKRSGRSFCPTAPASPAQKKGDERRSHTERHDEGEHPQVDLEPHPIRQLFHH